MKYDNCRGCGNVHCEHYGKNREFVCPGGKSCKVQTDFSVEAHDFCEAIKAFANNPEGLDNLKSYLAHHFGGWLRHMANTPENIAAEMAQFAFGTDLPF